MRTLPLLLTLLLAVAPASVPAAAQGDQEFRAFYAKFLDAMRRSDKQELADMIAFPADWSVERGGDVQTESVKDRADFLARYTKLVTPFMRSHVAGGKVRELGGGGYAVVWRDANAEFSFEFGRDGDKGYRVRSYTIGPE